MLPELGGEARPTRVFVSTYHDTGAMSLARHGITFRHRIEDGAGVWQLKLPRAGDVRDPEVLGEHRVSGDVGEDAERAADHHRRHDREPVQSVGEVDRVRRADDDEERQHDEADHAQRIGDVL